MAEERFRKDELVMLGTLRADGSPRISPCELDVAEGHLFLGMMWRSKKALDLSARSPVRRAQRHVRPQWAPTAT